jgi:predicted nucleic acid-binding Zn ribbon protein
MFFARGGIRECRNPMSNPRRPEKLASVLGDMLSRQGYLRACREAELVSHWHEYVGDKIASVTTCTESSDGVLYVKVHSAPWRQELSFLKQSILSALRKKSDCATIRDIVFY